MSNMVTIPDTELYKYADRTKGKVVIITGAASGFGKTTALLFGKAGAKVVVSDVSLNGPKGAETVAHEITQAGGQAIAVKCDVTSWEDQVVMFDTAVKTYGSVDVVVANAGVNELGNLEELQFDKNGKPLPPNTKTLDINLTGVLYTVNLGIHYLKQKPERGSMRAIILIGSMASWQAPQGGSVYAATKHGVLGLMRALYPTLRTSGIRIGTIHPWFADTGIMEGINPAWEDLLSALPKVPIARVAGAIFRAATDPDPATNGSVWMLPDGEPLLLLEREVLREGVYKLLDQRIKMRLREGKFRPEDYAMQPAGAPKPKL